MTTLATFRAKVKALREDAGLSRGGLASAAGINAPVLRDFENGRRVPSLETVRKLMAVKSLGLQIADVPKEYRVGKNLRRPRPRKARKKSNVPVGFARLSPAEKKELGRSGGVAAQASGRAHRFDQTSASRAGQLGGAHWKGNSAHMAELGRRGGMAKKTLRARRNEAISRDDQSNGAATPPLD